MASLHLVRDQIWGELQRRISKGSSPRWTLATTDPEEAVTSGTSGIQAACDSERHRRAVGSGDHERMYDRARYHREDGSCCRHEDCGALAGLGASSTSCSQYGGDLRQNWSGGICHDSATASLSGGLGGPCRLKGSVATEGGCWFAPP